MKFNRDSKLKNLLMFAMIWGMACKPFAPKWNETQEAPTTVMKMEFPTEEVSTKEFTPISKPYLSFEDADTAVYVYCDTKAHWVEKFEQNNVLFERLSFTKGRDKKAEWLKISKPNQPCELWDLTGGSGVWYNFEDIDNDGFKDKLTGAGRNGNYRVALFDTQTNDFKEIDHVFGEDTWAFDTLTKLYMDRSDNSEYRYGSNFEDIFKLYSFQNKQFKQLAQLRFFIDTKQPTKCLVEVQQIRDAKKMTVGLAVFNELATQAVAIHAPRLANDLKEAASSDAVEEKARKDHRNWVEVAKPIAENYFRQNLDLFF